MKLPFKIRHWLTDFLEKAWRQRGWQRSFLGPLSALFALLSTIRRIAYRLHLCRTVRVPVPVVMVGNLHVGGTGKTPLTCYLSIALQATGWKPGIVSRGYRGRSKQPTAVTPTSLATEIGDEPILLAETGCPVWVGADRAATAIALLKTHPGVNLILCDDGLQHYRLHRDLAICVLDGQSRWTSHHLLPMGPLREPWHRLQVMDAVVWNSSVSLVEPPAERTVLQISQIFQMHLAATSFYRLAQPSEQRQAADFAKDRTVAVTGIGNPQRFSQTLAALGLHVPLRAFPDHHAFRAEELAIDQIDAILITEKDAVKCRTLNNGKLWVLPVRATVNPDLARWVTQRLRGSSFLEDLDGP